VAKDAHDHTSSPRPLLPNSGGNENDRDARAAAGQRVVCRPPACAEALLIVTRHLPDDDVLYSLPCCPSGSAIGVPTAAHHMPEQPSHLAVSPFIGWSSEYTLHLVSCNARITKCCIRHIPTEA